MSAAPKAKKKPYPLKNFTYKPAVYDGISADKVKGITWFYSGPLCPGSMLWPSDIAEFYATGGEELVMRSISAGEKQNG